MSVIKIGFFDKINYGMIVNAFKQVCDRRDREVFFTIDTGRQLGAVPLFGWSWVPI